MRVAQIYKPVVIHAHSPFTCGIIANIVGRRKRIPSVYEMRGLWEDSHTSRHGITERSLRYRGVHFLEDIALKGADLCCVICDALKEELLARGIQEEKIVIVPNGVDVRTFVPGPPNTELQRRLGLEDKIVIGYIGSFFHYEGLELLVRAMIGLSAEFPELRLLLVGEGEVTQILKRLAEEGGIVDKVLFPGRIATRGDFRILPALRFDGPAAARHEGNTSGHTFEAYGNYGYGETAHRQRHRRSPRDSY